jgi:hypothetical protein
MKLHKTGFFGIIGFVFIWATLTVIHTFRSMKDIDLFDIGEDDIEDNLNNE